MTTILIARHGNNFDPGQTAIRVGRRTDLSLSESGIKQAKDLGNYLKQYKIFPVAVFTSDLKRTQETAKIALETADLNIMPMKRSMFNEIDFGPDEGKTYDQIVARIGAKSLEDWDTMAILPEGWIADVDQIVQDWRDFAAEMLKQYPNQTVLVVTSNGIGRFAPYLTKNFISFGQTHKLKLSTGALGSLTWRGGNWEIDYWNEMPATDIRANSIEDDSDATEYGKEEED